jgi:hypothetical protein
VVGVVEGLGLPTKIESLADFAALALLLLIVVSLVRERTTIPVPYLALAYVAVIAAGAIGADSLTRLIVSAHNFLFYQALALALAALAPREARNRAVVLSIVALMAAEFLITAIQAPIVPGVDQVVGTFGNWASSSTAFAIVTGACLALGVYAAGAGRSWWLAVAVVLPLFSIWASTRVDLLVMPAAMIAVCVAAWWAGRPASRSQPRLPWLRPTVIASIAAVVALFAGYGIFRPSEISLLTSAGDLNSYLRPSNVASGHGSSPPTRGSRVGNIANSRGGNPGAVAGNRHLVSVRGDLGTAASFRVNTGAKLARSKPAGGLVRVQTPGRQRWEGVDYTTPFMQGGTPYRISAHVSGAPGRLQLAIGDSAAGLTVKSFRVTPGSRRIRLPFTPHFTGHTGLAFRTPVRARTTFDIRSPRVGRRRAILGAPLKEAIPLTGHGVPSVTEQDKAAAHLIDGSASTFLFGAGLGTSTYEKNLGVNPVGHDARWAALNDVGTVLAELGWVGMAVLAACALGLALGSMAAARRAPRGSWTRALLIAYPGVLVVTVVAAAHGNPFRSVGPETMFWVLTGLVLASVLAPREARRSA